jgi:hypothetical protein
LADVAVDVGDVVTIEKLDGVVAVLRDANVDVEVNAVGT